ncbi:EAL domain-containing protein (plasmid) [Vibrio sp. HDW18]|uniref:EAL domain-containing protein n=1 Tax=Vibrio sp. HDW18 TaxID=2714948 RepID=UPI001407E19E|nr:EAL domain-containing protein [Vibrio sp. HDW18]QIL86691.1 EAL domain-containing protein [Vibrio sp. HDW18]
MLSKIPTKIALVIFISPLVMLLLTQQLWSSYLAQLLLNQKFAEINQSIEQRNLALDTMVATQVQSLTFSCNSNDMQLIRDPQFYNRFIRLIGIETAQGVSCSTIGYPIPLPTELSSSEMAMGYHLSATPTSQTASRELLIQYIEPRGRVFWVVDGSWAQELLLKPCSDCFYLKFRFLDPALSELTIQRGNLAILQQTNKLSVYRQSGSTPFESEQTLIAGSALHTYARQQIFVWGIPIALLFGFLFSISYLILRNYRNSIEGLIEKGIRDEEFIPYYQPIVDSRTREVLGYEVLLRWQKGQQLLPPSLFISAAENSGLVVEMTNQLIQRVCLDLEHIPAHCWISINVVADHLEQHHLSQLLEQLHWPYSERIKFELTERAPIKVMTKAQDEVASLLRQGYQFKLDDFGTGYGGFAYLQNLQITSIKIDKMFVDTINTSDVKISVLDSIIGSAQGGNIEVIAEGVEHQYQVDYLAQRGVYWIQGYFYAKPMPLEQVLQFTLHPTPTR